MGQKDWQQRQEIDEILREIYTRSGKGPDEAISKLNFAEAIRNAALYQCVDVADLSSKVGCTTWSRRSTTCGKYAAPRRRGARTTSRVSATTWRRSTDTSRRLGRWAEAESVYQDLWAERRLESAGGESWMIHKFSNVKAWNEEAKVREVGEEGLWRPQNYF